MTYRGRSDGLVVESDREKIITFKFTCHLRDLQRYCVNTSGVIFIFFIFYFFSFSPRQCVAPIALMDKPPLFMMLSAFRRHLLRWTASMVGSEEPVMCWAVFYYPLECFAVRIRAAAILSAVCFIVNIDTMEIL